MSDRPLVGRAHAAIAPTTVSAKVYRLPQTAAFYADPLHIDLLHADARAAAGVDYDVAAYDRVVATMVDIGVHFGSLHAAGQAQIVGRNVWIERHDYV